MPRTIVLVRLLAGLCLLVTSPLVAQGGSGGSVVIEGEAPGDEFGAAVEVLLDREGLPLLVAIGAPGADGGGGALYVVDLTRPRPEPPRSAAEADVVVLPGVERRLGRAVQQIEDVDGDGHGDLLVQTEGRGFVLGSAALLAGRPFEDLDDLFLESEPPVEGEADPGCVTVDLDDDGIDDSLCGAPDAGPFGEGRVTLLLSGHAVDGGEAGHEGAGSDPGPVHDSLVHERPFGLSTSELALMPGLQDTLPHLAGVAAGAELGLSMPWSSQSPWTLDGEEVEVLLDGAAGYEAVIDGRFVHSVPLAVPGGGPSVAVVFARGAEGELGMHWRLTTSRVERRGPLGGFATGNTSDRYFLDGRELLPSPMSALLPGLDTFEPKDGGPEIVTYDPAAELWSVRVGGLNREFGEISELCGATEVGPTVVEWNVSGEAVAAQRWHLCRQVDDRGNATLYRYDDLRRLLDVSWGEADASGPDPQRPAAQRVHRLQFEYAAANPNARFAAATDGVRADGSLLGSVTHRVAPDGSGHQLERAWRFEYDNANAAQRTLLAEVWLEGAPDADGVVRAATRLRQFHYRSDHPDEFDAGVPWSDPHDLSARFPGTEGMRVRVVRANHDALPDLLFLDVHERWKEATPPVCAQACPEPAEVDADTCFDPAAITCLDPSDPLWAEVCQAPVTARVFINVGDLQFEEDAVASGLVEAWAATQNGPSDGSIARFEAELQFVDINGDGVDDLVGPARTVLSAQGADWHALAATPSVLHPWHEWDLSGARVLWVDVDGDGRVDQVVPPAPEDMEDIPDDGFGPGGLCVASGGDRFWVFLNRTVGNDLRWQRMESHLRVPFFADGAWTEHLVEPNLALPIGPATIPSTEIFAEIGETGLFACDLPDGRPGYLVPSPILAQMDFDEASIAAATTGRSYLAQHLQFGDLDADGCADAYFSFETGPLKQIRALAPSFESFEDVPGYISEVFHGDCRGGFEAPQLDVYPPGAFLGWPTTRLRSRDWAPDAQVSCGSAPFNGLSLSAECDSWTLQPWQMRQCEPAANCPTCCDDPCGLAYEVCEDFDCSQCVGEAEDPEDLEPLAPYDLSATPGLGWPSSAPYCAASFEPYLPPGQPEGWDPMLRHRFARGVGERRPGSSLAATVGGQAVDLDGDGRVEWLQACTREGLPDPMSQDWVAPLLPASELKAAAGGYPLALNLNASWWIGSPEMNCESALQVHAGVEFVGALSVDGPLTGPPSMGRDVAALLVDLDADGFPDELTTDGVGGVTVRLQERVAPEHSLEAITYGSGTYPQGTSFLAWRAGNPLEHPNLPSPDLGIAELVDAAGHRVVGRAQCRVEGGRHVGCGVVVEQNHRGAWSKALYATRAELPGVRWLTALHEADGQLAGLEIHLPAGADLAGLDEEAPWFNPAWRTCSYAISDQVFDGSLQAYVAECLRHPSPYVPNGLASTGELLEVVGQVASAWPYVDGVLGHGVQIEGLPLYLLPLTPGDHQLFVSGGLFDEASRAPAWSLQEGYAQTVDDDLATELRWDVIPGEGARLHRRITTVAATGETYSDVELGYDGWIRSSVLARAGAESRTTSRTHDAYGRTATVTDAESRTSTIRWTSCGRERVTDPLSNWSETAYDDLCRAWSTFGSAGGGMTVSRDGLGLTAHSSRDPDTADPELERWSAVCREPSHFGDSQHPQAASTDGRSLELTFQDTRGRVALRRSCRLRSMPADPSEPSSFVCTPGTEVDVLFQHSDDGLVVASSAPHAPGARTTWTLYEHDSLGRPYRTQPALGTDAQVAGWTPGLEVGPPTQVDARWDRDVTWLPTGAVVERLRSPLLQEVRVDGDVVSQTTLRPDGRVASTTDAMLRTTTSIYDAWGQLEDVLLPGFWGVDESGLEMNLFPEIHYEYDATGRPEVVTDERGQPWSSWYDDAGRPTHLFGPDGAVVRRVVREDAQRRVTIIDAEDDALVVQTTDALGRTVGSSFPDGSSAASSWDEFGVPVTSVDRRGSAATTVVQWLGQGRRRLSVGFDDGSEEVTFVDAAGRALRSIDRDGVATDVGYDDWGRPTTVRLGAADPEDLSTWPSGEVQVERGYDELGRPSWSCPGGVSSGIRCSGVEYDDRGRVEFEHVGLVPANLDDPASWTSDGVFEHSYRDDGSLDWTRDPKGVVTDPVYDASGRLETVLVDGVSAGHQLYDATGAPVRFHHADGTVSETVLDDYGRVIERWSPGASQPATFGYWPDGALQWVEDGDGQANAAFPTLADRWLAYDGAGRPTTITEWNGVEQRFEYDGVDLTAITWVDPVEGALSRQELLTDPVTGRPISATKAISVACAADGLTFGTLDVCPDEERSSTRVLFSAAGRRELVTDGEGHSTTWTNDPVTGRLKAVTGEAIEAHLEYGPAGRLEYVTRGPLVSPTALSDLEYDARGRLESQSWQEVATGERFDLRWAYDTLGRTVWTDARADGQVTEETYLDYDAWGQVVQQGRNLAGSPSTIVPNNGSCDPGELCFDYDAQGRTTGVVYPDERAVAYEYVDGQLAQVCDGPSCAAGPTLWEVLARDPAGRETEVWRTGDVFETTTYDGGGLPDGPPGDRVSAADGRAGLGQPAGGGRRGARRPRPAAVALDGARRRGAAGRARRGGVVRLQRGGLAGRRDDGGGVVDVRVGPGREPHVRDGRSLGRGVRGDPRRGQPLGVDGPPCGLGRDVDGVRL